MTFAADPLTNNMYAFAGGNPVNRVEWDGHCANTEAVQNVFEHGTPAKCLTDQPGTNGGTAHGPAAHGSPGTGSYTAPVGSGGGQTNRPPPPDLSPFEAFAKGGGRAVVDTAKGLQQAVKHSCVPMGQLRTPAQMARDCKAQFNTLAHPRSTLNAAWNQTKSDVSAGSGSGTAGYALMSGLLFFTPGGAGAKGARLAGATGRGTAAVATRQLLRTKPSSFAYHYTSESASDSILNLGLRRDSYLTESGNMSPLQAQLNLALKPNRGLPGAVLRVDLNAMRREGFEIPPFSFVGRKYNMPGGGLEMQVTRPMPPRFITRIDQ